MKVLYIGGAGRSGSTLLELILGNAPGFVSVGEIRFWWEYMAQGGIRCGCGELLNACPFWSAVRARVLACNPALDIAHVADLSRRLDRTHNLLRYGRDLTPRNNTEVAKLVAATQQLYEAVWYAGGERIIVDSSKVPSHLYLLSQIPDLDLRLLQLVRDGRAVAYSWNKRRKKELAVVDGAHMARHSNLRSMLVWALENNYVAKFGQKLPQTAVMRYEDFAAEPEQVLAATLDDLGWPTPPLDMLHGHQPQPTHSVGGNPLRFSRTTLTVRLDTEWQEQMSPVTQKTLGLLFAPVLSRYDYSIW